MYFVQQGIQKSYYQLGDKLHVIAFTYPPSFSGIPDSFLMQIPSRYSLGAITDSQFLRISYHKHQALMQEHREIETLFRKAAEAFIGGMIQRQYELMALDIRSRFEAFAKRSPHLLNMVAQKDIASYLRIDATNLSKLLNSTRI
jgi:CRP-like cAMP-binding protein